MVNHTCKICGETKDEKLFSRNISNGKYYFIYCKECINAKRRKEYNPEKEKIRKQKQKDKNPERYKRIRHENYLKHKEEVIARNKKFIQENREEYNERVREYRERHREYFRKYERNYLKNNRNKFLEYARKQREKNKNNDLIKFRDRIRQNINQSFKRRKAIKKKHTEEIIGCSVDYLIIHLKETFKSNYGYEWNEKEPVHIDHIIPLVTAKNEEDIIKLNHYTNLQLLKPLDNLSKGKKILERN